MKKAMALKIQVEPKTVKRALAVMGLDIPTDEEIQKIYFGEDVKTIDLDAEMQEDSFALTLFFTAVLYAKNKEDKTPEANAD